MGTKERNLFQQKGREFSEKCRAPRPGLGRRRRGGGRQGGSDPGDPAGRPAPHRPQRPAHTLPGGALLLAPGREPEGAGGGLRLLRLSSLYDDTIFEWYGRIGIPRQEILRHGIPPDRRASQAYLRYLVQAGNTTDAVEAWNGIAPRGYADDELAKEFVNFLLGQHRYEAAADSWAQYLGPRRHGYRETNWLFNGDFELDPTGSPLDWKIYNQPGVEVAPDRSVARSGSRSLRIRFDGKENLAFNNVTQTAVVTPGRYRFEAFVRTADLTTDQGVGFRLFDPQGSSRVDVRTEPLLGTSDWKKIEQTFVVPAGTRLLQVQVVRPRSWKFDSKIRGAVWIDTVALRELSAAD
ncbi:MAG: carbohydrate binding domain-containing protein [Acidobacteria bacterium]|nr:carbohydrate binding domain-containing protein [Acidobacteriota bacterium]